MTTKAREFWIRQIEMDTFIHVREVLPSEESELVELRRDTERFYWLAKNQITIQEYKGKFTCFGGILITLNLGYYDTPRAAIDAAMESEMEFRKPLFKEKE